MSNAIYGAIIEADADEVITVAGTAVTLTLPAEFTRAGVSDGRVVIAVSTAAIIYTTNGVAPADQTVGPGIQRGAGDVIEITGLTAMRNFKAIRATASSGKLSVQYEKRKN